MRKNYIRHDNLRKSLEEVHHDNLTEDNVDRFINELKHSCLILAADLNNSSVNFRILTIEDDDYGVLFTDMDEFRKCFSDDECESNFFDFEVYKSLIEAFDLKGYIINPASEAFIFKRDLFDAIDDFPESEFTTEGAYDSKELKSLKDSINNEDLEEFIKNPSNIGNYDELFDKISKSTMLTLLLSEYNLKSIADDDVISLRETGPLGFLYIDEIGGQYATVYTSEDKISNIKTDLNKYSQLVNFSHMANFILNDDMDGIIINPNCENVLITRDILLKYSDMLEQTCNDSRLNSAILHMFILEE